MKKFLAMLLAALLVVSMFTFAMAEGTTEGGTTEGGTTEGGTTEGGTTEGGAAEGGAAEGGAAEGGAAEGGAAEGGAAEGGAAEGGAAEGGTETEETYEGKAETNCNFGKHDYSDTVIEYYPDECTGNLYEISVCSICGAREAQKDWTKIGPGKGHDFGDSTPSGATCITGGTFTQVCKRCGKPVEFKNTLSPDHNWVEAKGAYVAPTCVTPGVKKYICSWCGLPKDVEVPATGKHVFNLDFCDVKKRGTCEAWGTYVGKCINCGEEFEYKGNDSAAKADGTIVLKIPARGHDLRDVIVNKKVSCTKDGDISYKCRNNKASYEYEACNYAVEHEKVDHLVDEPNLLTGTVINKYHNLEVKILDDGKDTGYTTFVYKCTNDGCPYVSAQMTTKGTPSIQGNKANGDPTPVNTGAANTSKKPASSSTNKKGVSIPKTNDSTSNLPYVLIAAAFVGLVALVASKKKVHG